MDDSDDGDLDSVPPPPPPPEERERRPSNSKATRSPEAATESCLYESSEHRDADSGERLERQAAEKPSAESTRLWYLLQVGHVLVHVSSSLASRRD